jgi:hypothetical protein
LQYFVSACDRTFLIECESEEIAAAITAAFGGLIAPARSPLAQSPPVYRLRHRSAGRGYDILTSAGDKASVDDVGGLLFHLDKHLTIALQYQRSDLFFVHAAVVGMAGRAAVLAAPPGTGKSTLTLALQESGFAYLSDELAPIDVRTMTVHPYPHALCLKSRPPEPYRLPHGTFDAGKRLHVPVEALAGATIKEPLPVAAVGFIQRVNAPPPALAWISSARAATRLMASVLNPLAHQGGGLDAALSISQAVPCFELETSDLERACAAMQTVLGARP